MKRLAWDLLAAASLLAFVAAAVMWVSSYWWYDEVGVTVGRQLLAFNSAHGDSVPDSRDRRNPRPLDDGDATGAPPNHPRALRRLRLQPARQHRPMPGMRPAVLND